MPIASVSEDNVSSTPNVENGVQNNSITEIESGVEVAQFVSSSSGSTDGLLGSSPILGELGSSGSDENSLRGSMQSLVVGSNNRTKSSKGNSDDEYCVRRKCGMDEPDIKLESPDGRDK